jgi:hypothetical protein
MVWGGRRPEGIFSAARENALRGKPKMLDGQRDGKR